MVEDLYLLNVKIRYTQCIIIQQKSIHQWFKLWNMKKMEKYKQLIKQNRLLNLESGQYLVWKLKNNIYGQPVIMLKLKDNENIYLFKCIIFLIFIIILLI